MGMDYATGPDRMTVVNGQGTYTEIAKELSRRGTVEFQWLAVSDRPEHTVVFSVRKSILRGGSWLPSPPVLYCGTIDDEGCGALTWSDDTVDQAWVDHNMMFSTSEEDAAFATLFNGIWRNWVQISIGRTPVLQADDDPFKLTLPE